MHSKVIIFIGCYTPLWLGSVPDGKTMQIMKHLDLYQMRLCVLILHPFIVSSVIIKQTCFDWLVGYYILRMGNVILRNILSDIYHNNKTDDIDSKKSL